MDEWKTTDFVAILGFGIALWALLLAMGCTAEPLYWEPDLDLFPCDWDEECPSGEVCRDGDCWAACEDDNDCLPGMRCGELVGDLSGQGVCL